jgi:glycosyltransferase involved in cell wall biosynthesis
MTPSVPQLSVVVPTYRASDQLRALLASVAAQNVDPAMAEIIVIDDGTPGFEPSAWEGLAGDFPMTILHQSDNGGRAVARNAGIQIARGDVVIFLDGDMTMAQGFLQAHADFHMRHSGAIAVGAIRWASEVPDTPFMRYAGSRGVGRFAAGQVPYKCFVTGNSSVPRQALIDVGCFDEIFSTYGGEDLELGYRLHLAGLKVFYEPTACSLHHGWKGMQGMRESMATYGAGSLPLLLARHPELVDVLRLGFLRLPLWRPLRLAAAIAMWPAVHAVVHRLACWGERLGCVPALWFDYLWWYERTRAYLRASRQ